MSLIAAHELEQLLKPKSACCLSITMPCQVSGREVQQNAIRFRNLLKEARSSAGDCNSELEKTFASLERLAEDDDFWQHQSHGLALYSDGANTAIFRLPISFPELADVGLHYRLLPLVPALSQERSHYILCLTRGATRLLQSNGSRVSDVPSDLPDSIRKYLPEESKSFGLHSFRVRSGANDSAVPHGHPSADDDAAVKRYLEDVDEAVHKAIADHSTPIVFAGSEQLVATYRQITNYPSVVSSAVSGNFEDYADDDLAALAYDCVRPKFEHAIEQRIAATHEKVDERAVIDDVDAVLAAAADGAIETLFLNSERFFDSTTGSEPSAELHELMCRLERAVQDTLHSSGQILAVDGELIGDRNCLAGLRYPIDAVTVTS